jgi:broad specificity phosphatase PhoE
MIQRNSFKLMAFLTIIYFSTLCAGQEIPLKSFYLVRHGITQWNLDTKQQGQTDIPLHEKGIKQAEDLRGVCNDLPISHFWSSTLSRAHQTMKILNRSRNLPEFVDRDLMEQGKGSLEGITQAEWEALDRAVINEQMEDKELFTQRTERILVKILSQEGCPCIVAHSNNIRCITQLLGLKIKSIPHDVIWYFECPTRSDGAWKMTILKKQN